MDMGAILLMFVFGFGIIAVIIIIGNSKKWKAEEDARVAKVKQAELDEAKTEAQKHRELCEAQLSKDMTIAQVAGDNGIPLDASIEREIKAIMKTFPMLDFLEKINWRYSGMGYDDASPYARYDTIGTLIIDQPKNKNTIPDMSVLDDETVDTITRRLNRGFTSSSRTLHMTSPTIISHNILGDLLYLKNLGYEGEVTLVRSGYRNDSAASRDVFVGFPIYNVREGKMQNIFFKAPKQPLVHMSNNFAMVKLKDGNYAWLDKDVLAELQSKGESGIEVIDLRGAIPQ